MKRILITLTLITFLCGCSKTVYLDEYGNEIEQPNYLYGTGDRFEIINEFDDYLYEIRDVTTGVHYYLYEIYTSNGGRGLTPVYESDGSVRVSN